MPTGGVFRQVRQDGKYKSNWFEAITPEHPLKLERTQKYCVEQYWSRHQSINRKSLFVKKRSPIDLHNKQTQLSTAITKNKHVQVESLDSVQKVVEESLAVLSKRNEIELLEKKIETSRIKLLGNTSDKGCSSKHSIGVSTLEREKVSVETDSRDLVELINNSTSVEVESVVSKPIQNLEFKNSTFVPNRVNNMHQLYTGISNRRTYLSSDSKCKNHCASTNPQNYKNRIQVLSCYKENNLKKKHRHAPKIDKKLFTILNNFISKPFLTGLHLGLGTLERKRSKMKIVSVDQEIEEMIPCDRETSILYSGKSVKPLTNNTGADSFNIFYTIGDKDSHSNMALVTAGYYGSNSSLENNHDYKSKDKSTQIFPLTRKRSTIFAVQNIKRRKRPFMRDAATQMYEYLTPNALYCKHWIRQYLFYMEDENPYAIVINQSGPSISNVSVRASSILT